MKYMLTVYLLFAMNCVLTSAAKCSLDQSNACVFFVAANGDLCQQNKCIQENEPSCTQSVQNKCTDFLNLGGISCTYITENPYFTCEA